MSHAEARRDLDMAALLARHSGRQAQPSERTRVEALLQQGQLEQAERLLRASLHLVLRDDAGWGDGVMAGPANEGRHDVLAMLMRLGARVPRDSKWASRNYFEHEVTAAFPLQHGMDANHCHPPRVIRFTSPR